MAEPIATGLQFELFLSARRLQTYGDSGENSPFVLVPFSCQQQAGKQYFWNYYGWGVVIHTGCGCVILLGFSKNKESAQKHTLECFNALELQEGVGTSLVSQMSVMFCSFRQ